MWNQLSICLYKICCHVRKLILHRDECPNLQRSETALTPRKKGWFLPHFFLLFWTWILVFLSIWTQTVPSTQTNGGTRISTKTLFNTCRHYHLRSIIPEYLGNVELMLYQMVLGWNRKVVMEWRYVNCFCQPMHDLSFFFRKNVSALTKKVFNSITRFNLFGTVSVRVSRWEYCFEH